MAELAPDLQDRLEELEKELEVRFCLPGSPWFLFLQAAIRLSTRGAGRNGCVNLKSRLVNVMAT